MKEAGRVNPQSTYLPRVPECLTPRQNWDPHPLSRKRPEAKEGETHSPAGEGMGESQFGRLEKKPSEGVGSPNSDDWRKSLALCLLCGYRDV